MNTWERVEQRIRAAKPTLVLGASAPPPRWATDVLVVRVDCDTSPSGDGRLQPILEAERRARAALGDSGAESSLMDLAAQRVLTGLRRRLLGDEQAAAGPEERLAQALVQLRRHVQGPIALVFGALDQADAATLAVLEPTVEMCGSLEIALVGLVGAFEPTAAMRGLVEAVTRLGGADALIVVERVAPPPAAEPVPAFDWRTLPSLQRRILRAAAVMGRTFEAELLADLLRLDVLDVIEALQEAREAGLGLEDRGEGRFAVPAEVLAAARKDLLPSLAAAWHRRLARLLEGPPASAAWLPPERSEPVSEPPVVRVAEAPAPAPEPPARAPDLPARASDPPARASDPPARQPEQPARAAAHAEAAGDLDQAVERLIQAAEQATRRGDHVQARDLADRALALLGRLPSTPVSRRLRARALLEVGLAQGYGPEQGPDFSLDHALDTLDEALVLARKMDDARLQAEAASAVASVCYDIGTPDKLERALAELADASRALIRAGLNLEGARLLNDQAAVWVRIGDPVRAHHLLEQSRQVFAQRAEADPAARLEMAETEHLLARLVLHVQARPGRESEAVEAGLRHAQAAADAYQALGLAWQAGRVWETIGRLKLAAGQVDEAADVLGRAAQVQEQLGDVIGLARTAAAFADVLIRAGDPKSALMALQDSIRLNLDKGATRGLEFNRQTLDRLAQAAGPHLDEVQRLQRHLGSAALGGLTADPGRGRERRPGWE